MSLAFGLAVKVIIDDPGPSFGRTPLKLDGADFQTYLSILCAGINK